MCTGRKRTSSLQGGVSLITHASEEKSVRTAPRLGMLGFPDCDGSPSLLSGGDAGTDLPGKLLLP